MIEQQFGIKILPTWHESPDSSPEAYTSEVRLELSRILRSDAGEILAKALRFHGKTVLIMPYEEQDCNAQEDAVTAGSDQSVVLYSPRNLHRSACSKLKREENNATLPHEILFHELVHALRRISKKMHKWPLKGRLSSYTHSEEFIAILVTNIFISDVTNTFKTGLRASHEGHGALEKELAESFFYFRNGTKAFNLIASFCDENRGFTKMLTGVRARFNPVAAIYRNRQRAFEMAASGDADATFQSLIPMDYYQKPSGAWTRIGAFPKP